MARPLEVMLCGVLPADGWLGVELYLDELERHLGARAGLHVRVDPATRLQQPPGNRASRLAMKYLRYPRAIARETADIFHIVDHSYGHLAWALKRRQQRIVVTCHDLYNFERRHETVGLVNRVFVNRHILGGLRRADRIVALSEATKRDVIQLLGIPEEQITINPQGVESAFRPLARKEAIRMLRTLGGLADTLPADFWTMADHAGKILLHVGGCYKRKNIPAILRSLAVLVKDHGLNAVLIKVGDPFSPAQEDLVGELALQGRIIHVGRVSQDHLVALYTLADVLVFPSLHEGFGRPVAEAMACGLPIVCSNLASLPELVGQAAVSVDPTDIPVFAGAIRDVLTTPGLAASLRAAGLERAKQYTWPRHCERLEAIYREVCR